MLLDDVVKTSTAVSETQARSRKIGNIADLLRRTMPKEVPIAVAYLSGELPQGSIGVGWAALRERPAPAPVPPELQLLEVDAALSRLQSTSGPGSQALRRRELADLLGRATEPEQRFLSRLLAGELRQGALGGVAVEAVARAYDVPAAEVRRALMLAGDLGAVATAAAGAGRQGLAGFRLSLLRPVQPMLAQTAATVDEALRRTGRGAIEWKLDGARLQVHRLGGEVRAFTRTLADVTERVPEVVEEALRLPVEAVVLDGEVIALDERHRPRPFQVTMGRFGSRLASGDLRAEVPLSTFFFDLLHLDGEDLIDRPGHERHAALAARVPPGLRPSRLVTGHAPEAERFLEDALRHGHEGVMVKSLEAPYEAGRRGAAWLKVKRVHTLDLVVLAAEWGHGRRRGWLSNLHLGARDPSTGGFVMLGKTFKGMTDELLAWQTQLLLGLEERREAHTVHVRPELVVEIAFDGLQTSTRYAGGLALRFARVKGYRPDKPPEDADTIETVRTLHAGSPTR